MSWLDALHFLPKPPDPRPSREIEGDILTELQFHLDMKARDLEATGMKPEQARETAREKFGDFDRVFQSCRKAQLGEKIMLQRVLVVMMIFLTGAVTFLAISSYRMNEATAASYATMQAGIEKILSAQAKASSNSSPSTLMAADLLRSTTADPWPLTGRIEDRETKRPISGAKLLLIVKTWEGNEKKLIQSDYATQSDMEGRFSFDGVLPFNPVRDFACNLSAIAAGYALESKYLLVKEGGRPLECNMQLSKGKERVLSFVHSFPATRNSEPLAGYWVFPSKRYAQDGSNCLVYFQGSRSIWEKTDSSGQIRVSWFGEGEDGSVYIGEHPDKMSEVTITADRVEIEVPLRPSAYGR